MTINTTINIADLIGFIATVVSLVYVAIQIRSNTSWKKREALESVIDRRATWSARVRENQELLELYIKGNKDFNSLNEFHKQQYHLIMGEIMAVYETMLEHAKVSGIKNETKEAAEKGITELLDNKGTKEWWSEIGMDQFASDFSTKVDILIKSKNA